MSCFAPVWGIGRSRVPFPPLELVRPVGDGDELLRAGVGDRPQPRPLAAAEDEPLHRDPGARIAAGYQQVPGVSPSRNGPATTSDAPVATMVTVQRGAKIGLTNTANPLNATTLCQGDAPRGGAPLPPLVGCADGSP